MEPIILVDTLRITHLIGLALGFGVAMLADLYALRSLVVPLKDEDFDTLERMHHAVTVGLVILWGSGLGLLAVRTGFDPAAFSPKLMMKLAVVLFLTANAIIIGRVALPVMEAYADLRFGELPFAERARLACVAGFSFAFWISALSLGAFSAMKTMQAAALIGIIGGIVSMATLGAAFMVVASPHIARFAAQRHHWQAAVPAK
ncbi:MAG: hypothetical protein AAFN59_10995 [Pseudomonadota bacterium]